MSAWINPDTHIEHDAAKRAAAIQEEKEMIARAYSHMNVWRDTLEGYKSGIRDGAVVQDAIKLATYEHGVRKAVYEFHGTFASCSRRAAYIDFISAALAAGKSDEEIQAILVPVNECSTQDGSKAIFKALIIALGGTMTELE